MRAFNNQTSESKINRFRIQLQIHWIHLDRVFRVFFLTQQIVICQWKSVCFLFLWIILPGVLIQWVECIFIIELSNNYYYCSTNVILGTPLFVIICPIFFCIFYFFFYLFSFHFVFSFALDSFQTEYVLKTQLGRR